MKRFFKKTFFFLILFLSIFFAFSVQAENTGTVPASVDCSGNLSCAVLSQDANSKINFGCANCNFQVSDTSLSGFAWGENIGWIKFKSTDGNSWGVSNTTSGILSGYAWGENAGWINFGPFNNNSAETVKINTSNGYFNGYAWSQNYGWLKFECPGPACVRTTWKPETEIIIVNPPPPPPPTCPAPNTLINGVCTPPSVCTPGIDCFCDLNPTAPSCVTPDFCITHPTDPSCIITPPPPNPTCEELGNCPTDDGDPIIDPIIHFINNISPFSGFLKDNFTPEQVEDINLGLKLVSIGSALMGGAIALGVLLFLNPLAAPELILIPFRLWSLLLTALGLKKRTKPWGTVYDAVTKQPLDPVYVSLFNLEGEEVASSITDIDGRYGFFVQPGVYKVLPRKTNYIFPSHALSEHFSDEFYQDLYFGDYINISEGEIIVRNIPMDPVNFDWNEFAKNKKQLLKYYSKRELIAARVSNILFGFGFSVAGIALLVSPETYNIVIFTLYVVMFVLRKTSFKFRAKGRAFDKDGNPLSFAFIRACSVSTNVEIAHQVTDKMGRYHMLLPNGTYYVKIEKKNDDGTYKLIHTSEEIKVIHGILNKVFNI